MPLIQRDIQTSWGGSAYQGTREKYNANGLLYDREEYSLWTPQSGYVLYRTTTINYAALNGISDHPQSVTVSDSSNNTVAQTNYGYDETAAAPTTGTPQHVSVSAARGNLTTVSRLVSGTTFLNTTYTYFDTGLVQTVTEPNSAQTTTTYGDCGNSFPTYVSFPVSLHTSAHWDCNGGVMLWSKDENDQQTSLGYGDSNFWRPTSTTDPSSVTTNVAYTSTTTESAVTFNGQQSTVDVLQTTDALGRPHVSQQRQGPGSTNFDSVETDYNAVGIPYRTSRPYTGTAGLVGGSVWAASSTFDALGRPTLTTDGGNGTVSHSYTLLDDQVTIGPAPANESVKSRQLEHDEHGRLASVCEVTTATGSGNCGQTNPRTGYWTTYSYNVLDVLTGVTQNAQASSGRQTRSFTYDALRRMTQEINPETGTTSYVYDSDATCGTSKGDLVKKTDAVGNVTCYSYDALHRITAVTYPSGAYATVTPEKHYVYDGATVNSTGMANAKGRLAEAYTGASSSKVTDVGLSYSARGQVTDIYRSAPHSGGYYHLTKTYWESGLLKQIGGLPLVPTVTYSGLDSEGRANQITASSGQSPLVSSASYNTAGQVSALTFGSGDGDSYSYDSVTGRMTQYAMIMGTQGVTGNLTWNSNGSLQQLASTDTINSSNSQTCGYSADDLGRIASVSCGTIWAQSFTYDVFGNINKSGSLSFQPTYDSSTNRYTSYPGLAACDVNNPCFDANGNILRDPYHTYQWDADGHLSSMTWQYGPSTYTYDAFGQVAEVGPWNFDYQYDESGKRLGLTQGQTATLRAMIPLVGGTQAYYNNNGLAYYRHTDWLGSDRLDTTPSRTLYSDPSYAPFGEQYGSTNSFPMFAGYWGDTVSDVAQSELPFRRYDTRQGRWLTPDPARLAAADLLNPQSLNRYAYVLNNPLKYRDPLGLYCVYFGKTDEDWADAEIDSDVDQATCEGSGPEGGGTWFDNPTTTVTVNGDTGDVAWLNTGLNGYFDPVGYFNEFAARARHNYINGVNAPVTSQQYIQAIANAAPTICGGGVFGYFGAEAPGPVHTFAGGIAEYDTREGGSAGTLWELGAGEGVFVGGGKVEGPGGAQNIAYVGAGIHTPVLEGGAGIVGYKSGAGAFIEGGTFGLKAGVGAYMNITTNAECKP